MEFRSKNEFESEMKLGSKNKFCFKMKFGLKKIGATIEFG